MFDVLDRHNKRVAVVSIHVPCTVFQGKIGMMLQPRSLG